MPKQSTKRTAGDVIAFRASPAARKQLDELMLKSGENQTQTIIRAIAEKHFRLLAEDEATRTIFEENQRERR